MRLHRVVSAFTSIHDNRQDADKQEKGLNLLLLTLSGGLTTKSAREDKQCAISCPTLRIVYSEHTTRIAKVLRNKPIKLLCKSKQRRVKCSVTATTFGHRELSFLWTLQCQTGGLRLTPSEVKVWKSSALGDENQSFTPDKPQRWRKMWLQIYLA